MKNIHVLVIYINPHILFAKGYNFLLSFQSQHLKFKSKYKKENKYLFIHLYQGPHGTSHDKGKGNLEKSVKKFTLK